MDNDYQPMAWVIWCMDRDYKQGNGDPIENALALAMLNKKQVEDRIAWLQAGAPGWTKKGASFHG